MSSPIRSPMSIRCADSNCNKKLTLAQQALKCRCEKIFCEAHRPIKAHDCTFDYQGYAREQGNNNLGKRKDSSHDLSSYNSAY